MVQLVYGVPSVLLTKPLSECYGGIRKSQRTNVIGKQKYTVKEKAPLEYLTWERFWRTDERST